ncbi:hypothetical protein FB567DRAFT_4211 [Paraphoma chrysanthemicola]|uniref:Uncharacterized protein n=1 Tax=Paraphoma chrysanthemicola TaxID=798071 RepID=A0A8K0W3N7_9PLEO|nr:hypothetical protein FB567DRAFT_4211 [Paraphoma chrysanthemicola]
MGVVRGKFINSLDNSAILTSLQGSIPRESNDSFCFCVCIWRWFGGGDSEVLLELRSVRVTFCCPRCGSLARLCCAVGFGCVCFVELANAYPLSLCELLRGGNLQSRLDTGSSSLLLLCSGSAMPPRSVNGRQGFVASSSLSPACNIRSLIKTSSTRTAFA